MEEHDTGAVDRSGHGPEGASIPVPRLELRRLGDEVAVAMRAVTEARASRDALDALGLVTVAIESLSATQHWLVSVLLDHGHTWSEVGEALSTTASAAERRFPRRRRGRPPAAP
jgi:hypothetical protein